MKTTKLDITQYIQHLIDVGVNSDEAEKIALETIKRRNRSGR